MGWFSREKSDATKVSRPLCRCCEEALSDDMHDPHLGPVCAGCFLELTNAKGTLQAAGYTSCQALGPDHGKGVLG